MSTRSEIRAKARETLGGGIFKTPWLAVLLVFVVASIIMGALGATGFLAIVSLIITGPVMIGVYSYLLKYVRYENDLNKLDPLFDGFKNDAVGNIILGVLQSVFIALWTLLFVIPGIVKSYSYAMAYYIKIDNPNMSGNDAITESRKMMNGHKMELFLLDLSFIGWISVGIATLGIGLLWVQPYMEMARIHFYEELKPKKKPQPNRDSNLGASSFDQQGSCL